MEIERPGRLTNAQHKLQRWTASLVLLGCAVGWLMVVIPFRDLLVKFVLYQLHPTMVWASLRPHLTAEMPRLAA